MMLTRIAHTRPPKPIYWKFVACVAAGYNKLILYNSQRFFGGNVFSFLTNKLIFMQLTPPAISAPKRDLLCTHTECLVLWRSSGGVRLFC